MNKSELWAEIRSHTERYGGYKLLISRVKGTLFLKRDVNVIFNALSGTNKTPFTSVCVGVEAEISEIDISYPEQIKPD